MVRYLYVLLYYRMMRVKRILWQLEAICCVSALEMRRGLQNPTKMHMLINLFTYSTHECTLATA